MCNYFSISIAKVKEKEKTMKKIKAFLKVGFMFALLAGTITTASAYNAKFAFDLDSGWMSPWAYSSVSYKASYDESPIASCTYAGGSTRNFEYTVVNSDYQSRVVNFTKDGTFKATPFGRHTTVQNYQYRLGVTRHGGSWNSSANTQGNWSPDSY